MCNVLLSCKPPLMSILCLSEGGCIDDDDDDDVADVCEGEHKAMWFEPPGHSCEGI